MWTITTSMSSSPSAKSKRGTQFRIWATGILAVLSSLLMAFAPGLFLICAAMGLNALSNTMFSMPL